MTTAPPVVQPSSGNAIIINTRQRGNPLLDAIRNVAKEFGDVVADFQVGRTTGVLYLSLKYHRLYPVYIHGRIQDLGQMYNLRILLILCDVSEHQDPIRELTKICLINNITVIVAWSIDEAGMYLSIFKQYEHKPPTMIKERVEKDYNSIFRAALTSIKSINKTDAETLRSHCGSFAGIARASEQSLLNLPGLGQLKVRRLHESFQRPFHGKVSTALDSFVKANSISADRNGGASEASVPKVIPPSLDDTSASISLLSTMPADKPRPPRSPSPIWDIELDLNDTPHYAPDSPPAKKQKVDHLFGEPSGIINLEE